MTISVSRVGDSLADLAGVRSTLEADGVEIHMALDHHQALGDDVDAHPRVRHDDPTQVAISDPVRL